MGKVVLDFIKLVIYRFLGLEEVIKVFEMVGKIKDVDGKLVLKVVIDSSGDV